MIIQKFNLPQSTYIDKTVFKKLILDKGLLDKNKSNILQDKIDKIILKNNLKKDSINIQPYSDEEVSYMEILIFEIILKEKCNPILVGEILDSIIPFPVIIEIIYEEKFWLYVSQKRKHKNIDQEFTFENQFVINLSEEKYLKYFDEVKLPYTTFFDFYSSIYNFLIKLRIIQEGGDENNISDFSYDKLREIEKLKSEIGILRNKMNKEKQLNKKQVLLTELRQKDFLITGLLLNK